VQKKTTAPGELPAQKNAQQGVERVFVADAIEPGFAGTSPQHGALKYILKFGRRALRDGKIVQRNVDRLPGRACKRSVSSRCRAEQPRVGHLEPERHTADGQLELLLPTAP
jgi:hypothetical protein